MANKSKQKGNSFERELCCIFSDIFKLSFQRVPNSGAFTGGSNFNRYDKMSKEQKLLHDGDIIVPEELSHVSIECKNYKEFAFHLLFIGKNSTLDTWIKQASHTNKPYWLLFFKITRKNTYVCYLKSYNFSAGMNSMCYNDLYYIENAENFLINNRQRILELKK